MNRRQVFENEGRKAESRVSNYLRLRGYKIIDERFKTAHGEIDIIARKGKVIAFVEVKQRASQKAIDESMDWHAEQRIMAAAEIWVERYFHDLPLDFDMRFDFAAVVGRVSPFCNVIYLKHAFCPH